MNKKERRKQPEIAVLKPRKLKIVNNTFYDADELKQMIINKKIEERNRKITTVLDSDKKKEE